MFSQLFLYFLTLFYWVSGIKSLQEETREAWRKKKGRGRFYHLSEENKNLSSRLHWEEGRWDHGVDSAKCIIMLRWKQLNDFALIISFHFFLLASFLSLHLHHSFQSYHGGDVSSVVRRRNLSQCS